MPNIATRMENERSFTSTYKFKHWSGNDTNILATCKLLRFLQRFGVYVLMVNLRGLTSKNGQSRHEIYETRDILLKNTGFYKNYSKFIGKF